MKSDKIAPKLLLALEDYQRRGHAGLTRHMKTMGLVSTEASPKPARVVIFLHCDDRASFGVLAKQGIRVNQSRGTVRTAILPLEEVGALSEHKAVERIVPARKLRPLMDVAPGKVNLPAFVTSSGLTGKGVIVGTVDSGIDPKHPAFAGAHPEHLGSNAFLRESGGRNTTKIKWKVLAGDTLTGGTALDVLSDFSSRGSDNCPTASSRNPPRKAKSRG